MENKFSCFANANERTTALQKERGMHVVSHCRSVGEILTSGVNET